MSTKSMADVLARVKEQWRKDQALTPKDPIAEGVFLQRRMERVVAAGPRAIAQEAHGDERVLRELLRAAGARLVRVADYYSGPQLHVRFLDGTLGFYTLGGPAKRRTYSFTEGYRPGDERLAGEAL